MSDIQLQRQEGRFNRYKITSNGRVVTCLNLGGTAADFFLLRPTLHPLYTPRGLPVTEQGAHNFPHHKGVWIGHARVNGVNCFHDYPGCGRIAVQEIEARVEGGHARIDLLCHWADKDGRPVLAEARRYAILPGGQAHTVEIESTLRADFGPVEFQPDKHAYLGVRVIDAIDEDDGGAILNANGERGEEGTMGKVADWCDYSGRMAGFPIGVAIMVHPTSPKAPFFTRSYGTFLSDCFYDRGLTLRPGETFRQRFAVVAHDGDAETFDLPGAYAAFAEGTALS